MEEKVDERKKHFSGKNLLTMTIMRTIILIIIIIIIILIIIIVTINK